MTITSPKYNFVRFGSPEENPCCDMDNTFCVPIFSDSDNFFQVKTDADATLQLVLLRGTGNDASTLSANTLRNWTSGDGLSFDKYNTGPGAYIHVWQHAFFNFATYIKCDECFQLALIGGDAPVFSNPFKRICSDCYTSIVEFYNDDNYAGFEYCNVTGMVNRVRLPLYLSQPQSIEDKTVYRRSNGVIRQTKSLLTKEFIGLTDFMPEYIHDKITVALAHDYINVISESYNGGISKSAAYAIEWNDTDCYAPANFKALATPYAISNSNCQSCEDFAPCVAVTVPTFLLPSGSVGVPYNQTITLGGTAVISLSSIVKPSWMSISVSGIVVTFSGTPNIAGAGFLVSFIATNGCGSDSGSTTISVSGATCIPVGITGTPVLPDAYSGMAYSYSILLSGTAPFSLSSIVKPSWMTINISSYFVFFSGTPTSGDVNTGVNVGFTVNNCSGAPVYFADTIDVIQSGTRFGATTFVCGDSLNDSEIANITGGAAGAIVVVTLDSLTNNNGGTLKVNGSTAYAGNTFNITLDGSGNGSFSAVINGVANPSSVILGHFTITSVSAGTIGTPDTYQISKVF